MEELGDHAQVVASAICHIEMRTFWDLASKPGVFLALSSMGLESAYFFICIERVQFSIAYLFRSLQESRGDLELAS